MVNIITGKGSKSGQYMLDHPGFRKLAFTGSTEVGLSVSRAAADKLIPATLELGGKSANIYFEDCQWDKAIDGLQLGILFNQGQVCCAGSRVFVQDTIYDKFVEAAVEAFNKVKVGDPLDPATQMGALVNEHQLKIVQSYVDIGSRRARRSPAEVSARPTATVPRGCSTSPPSWWMSRTTCAWPRRRSSARWR